MTSEDNKHKVRKIRLYNQPPKMDKLVYHNQHTSYITLPNRQVARCGLQNGFAWSRPRSTIQIAADLFEDALRELTLTPSTLVYPGVQNTILP